MITEMVVRNVKPRETAYKIADAQSLYLFVTPSGFRSWRCNYWFAGKSKTLVLGDYPAMSLRVAREKRDQAREALRAGRDPGIMKKLGIYKVGGERSFEAVARKWHEASKPVIVAKLIAWPVAWWVMRDWLNGFDARIDLGPGPFLIAGVVALVIALGTIAGHALKVSRANPIRALRYE